MKPISKPNNSSIVAKDAAGKAASEMIEPGMIIGLGTGSTVNFFIEHLAQRCHEGLQISAVATSKRSADLAKSKGIPVIDNKEVTFVDLAVDGADEVDHEKRLLKGGGGALLREKIVANMAREFVVIIDESKRVPYLGKFPLAVEIVPFAFHATLYKFEQLGYHCQLRPVKDGEIFVTENGNYIVDINLKYPCQNPEEDDKRLKSIPGVVETGFFLGMTGRVIIGFIDGRVEFWE